MVKKSKRKLVKSMRDAKKALMLKIEIGDFIYEFEADVFDIDNRNIGILNEQISKIPGFVAFIIEAYGEAERALEKKKLVFEIWKGQHVVKYFNNPKDYKSDQSRIYALMKSFPKEYAEFENELMDLKKLVRVLKAYEKGIDAKLQLAQTMSANIRVERDSYSRDYDKNSVGRPSGSLD